MNKKLNVALYISIFALCIVLAVIAYSSLSSQTEMDMNLVANEGDTNDGQNSSDSENKKLKAPDFTMPDGKGASINLSDFFGKPIVINFWASWCPPCKSEMPEFEKLFQELGDEINFIMVNLVDNERETKDIGAKYIEEQGYTFPVYFDTKQEGAYTYVGRSIPATFFIDRNGYIIARAEGAMDEDTLRRGIDLIK